MKQTTVEFSFEDEKLEAIKIFLNDKNTTLTDKLVSFMESLYNDCVPEDVRSYIERKCSLSKAPSPRRVVRKKQIAADTAVSGINAKDGATAPISEENAV